MVQGTFYCFFLHAEHFSIRISTRPLCFWYLLQRSYSRPDSRQIGEAISCPFWDPTRCFKKRTETYYATRYSENLNTKYGIGSEWDILIYHGYIKIQLSENFQYLNMASTESMNLKCSTCFLRSKPANNSLSRNLSSFSSYCHIPIFISNFHNHLYNYILKMFSIIITSPGWNSAYIESRMWNYHDYSHSDV